MSKARRRPAQSDGGDPYEPAPPVTVEDLIDRARAGDFEAALFLLCLAERVLRPQGALGAYLADAFAKIAAACLSPMEREVRSRADGTLGPPPDVSREDLKAWYAANFHRPPAEQFEPLVVEALNLRRGKGSRETSAQHLFYLDVALEYERVKASQVWPHGGPRMLVAERFGIDTKTVDRAVRYSSQAGRAVLADLDNDDLDRLSLELTKDQRRD